MLGVGGKKIVPRFMLMKFTCKSVKLFLQPIKLLAIGILMRGWNYYYVNPQEDSNTGRLLVFLSFGFVVLRCSTLIFTLLFYLVRMFYRGWLLLSTSYCCFPYFL